MAIVSYSPIVTALSGKVADAVFSRWKGRSYLRRRVVPANPNTAAQQLVRDSMGRLPALWRSLNADLKAQLDAYAADQRMSGWNWFASHNRVLEQTYDAAAVATPNALIDPVATLVLTAAPPGSITVTWTNGTESAAHKVLIYIRKVTPASEALVYTQKTRSTVLTSAHTYEAIIGVAGTYRVIVVNENTTLKTFSAAVSAEQTIT